MDSAVSSFESDRETENPGAVLASERQRLGWSVGDVAAKLRMSIVQVEALERSDYARLPTGTFLRGFVRSYAKLLGLDPGAVLTLLENSHADGRRPPIVVPSQNIKITGPGERLSAVGSRTLLLIALVLTLAVGFTYWWFFIKPGQSATAATSVTTGANGDSTPVAPPATQAAEPAPVAAPVSAPSDPVGPAKAAQPAEPVAQPAVEARPAVQPPAASKPAVPAGSGSLRFVFGGESWVEVVEGSGRTIVSRKYQAGEVEHVVGKLPLSVVIGNAPSTRLTFNDVNFDLTPHTKIAVARFTLK